MQISLMIPPTQVCLDYVKSKKHSSGPEKKDKGKSNINLLLLQEESPLKNFHPKHDLIAAEINKCLWELLAGKWVNFRK